ncbi:MULTISPECIES: hypothetical protein [Spirulina sp. CCY15215]|uniref:hypothetical protein n=1 Tax=Spirulina sp. CCY15215 TaxID=2767591 RepID=UPI0019507F68|nr:hypothetical protein [Spirulina major]
MLAPFLPVFSPFSIVIFIATALLIKDALKEDRSRCPVSLNYWRSRSSNAARFVKMV